MNHSHCAFTEAGVTILYDYILPQSLRDALRLINAEGWRHTKDVSQLERDWRWFPWLEQRPEIQGIARLFNQRPPDDTHIVLSLPHIGPEPEIAPHVDSSPHGKFREIISIPLTSQTTTNGAMWVWSDGGSQQVLTKPGDVVVMKPDVLHSPGVNRSEHIRYAIYFRWLEQKEEPDTTPVD